MLVAFSVLVTSKWFETDFELFLDKLPSRPNSIEGQSRNVDPEKLSYFNEGLQLTLVADHDDLDDDMMDMSELEQSMESYGDAGALDSDIFCEICNTGFRHMSSLRYHRKHRVCLKPKRGNTNPNKTHTTLKLLTFLDDTEPKVHQCEKCEKVFATGSGYKYHVRRSVCEQECEKGSPLPTHKHTNFSVFNTFFQMVPKCFSVRCV